MEGDLCDERGAGVAGVAEAGGRVVGGGGRGGVPDSASRFERGGRGGGVPDSADDGGRRGIGCREGVLVVREVAVRTDAIAGGWEVDEGAGRMATGEGAPDEAAVVGAGITALCR